MVKPFVVLTEEELTDPETDPNPAIKALIDIAQKLHRKSMEGAAGSRHYYQANQCVLTAVMYLYALKNELAGEGQPFTPPEP